MASDDKTRQLTHEDVVRLAGELSELKLARILETKATLGELEEACTLAAGDGEGIGGVHVELSGAVADIYDILTQEEAFEEDR